MPAGAVATIERPLRVLLWGTYDTGKPRVRLLREGLRCNGADVIELHHPLWDAIEDKSQVGSLKRWLGIAFRLLCAYPRLILRYLLAPQHDVALVAYPGLIDLYVLKPFAWMRRTPLAWDWFLSAYDTIVLDRELLSPRNPTSRLIRAIEWTALRLADVTFMDTAAHARRMERLFGLEPDHIGWAWVGAEQSFRPNAAHASVAPHAFTVLFYGQFIPLHGTHTILEAATALRDEEIDWWVIGSGQEARGFDDALAKRLLPRMHRIEWIPYGQLLEMLVRADVVLGIFGETEKAASVIPNKIFQAVMARRPVITRDSPAIREFLLDRPPFVQLIRANDPTSLAEAVLRAKNTPSPPFALDLPLAPFDATAVGQQLVQLLRKKLPSAGVRT